MNRFEIASDPEKDLDTYEDLLEVVKAYAILRKKGLLTKKEIDVLESVPSITSAAKVLSFSRNTVFYLYKNACNKIGEYLGGYFTDEGFINYMREKYKLTEQQSYSCKLFINSKFRFKIMRKQYNA
jgi:hypothetical protein